MDGEDRDYRVMSVHGAELGDLGKRFDAPSYWTKIMSNIRLGGENPLLGALGSPRTRHPRRELRGRRRIRETGGRRHLTAARRGGGRRRRGAPRGRFSPL